MRLRNGDRNTRVSASTSIPFVAALIALSAWGVASAQEQPPTANVEAARRRARRPPAARIQTDLKLASQTKAEFRQPAELAYKDFNDLTLQVQTFENRNAAEPGLPSKFQLLCYNNQPVGPTIRVHRGTTFHIHLKNDLRIPTNPRSHAVDNNSEQPHDLCTTNLHTHGLHVSPVGNADNIFVEIKPQDEFTFEYTVPADHPAGTFWYHPHHHGSVAYQLSNGLAGALIVEGSRRDGMADLESLPEIAAAKERILVLQLYNYRVDPPGEGGIARIDATTIYDVPPDARACPAVAVPEGDPTEKGQATAINGVINPIIRIAPGEVQRWRLIHAAWDVKRRLYVADSQGKPATDLHFYEIALDGLATGTMIAKGNDTVDSSGPALVEVAPGQRSDVLIQGPRLDEGERERTYYLQQSAQELSSGDAPARENLILAKILVSGPPRSMRLPDARQLVKCQPFAPVRDEELATTGTSELVAKGLNFFASAGTIKRFWINQKTFSQYKSPVQIRLDTAEQWTVKAVADNHPFHIHANAFQVVMRSDAQGKCQPMNSWRDTLFVRQGESYTIRSRFKDFLGKTVVHCHFLDHEDQGMMMPIEFIPPYQAPKPATMAQAGKLDPTWTVAPAVRLADVAGAWHDLTEMRPRNVILVFFQGMGCSECTAQLSKLVREAGRRIDAETEIVAVSSQRIVDADKAFKTLGVRVARRFHLLVDEQCRAFRDFGCYEDAPLHGLFLIDRSGVIRASYRGQAPFTDVQPIADQLRSIMAAKTTR